MKYTEFSVASPTHILFFASFALLIRLQNPTCQILSKTHKHFSKSNFFSLSVKLNKIRICTYHGSNQIMADVGNRAIFHGWGAEAYSKKTV